MRKTLTIEGIILSYVEKNETARQIIFFIHGNSSSSRLWKKQLNSEVFDHFRLIAIDLPAHGLSSGSNNPWEDYSPTGTARIMALAIQQLAHADPYILVGFSYGTNLIAEMLAFGVQPKGMVMMGACVIGKGYSLDKVFMPTEMPSVFLKDKADRVLVEQFLKQSLHTNDEEALADLTDDYFTVKHPFRAALMQGIADGKVLDETGILSRQHIPICFIFGEAENIVRINYLDNSGIPVWRKIFKLPDAGHWANLDSPEQFNQLVAEYALEMFTKTHA
jgi:pimeloyl-ACP methyl ester carboxylesterase